MKIERRREQKGKGGFGKGWGNETELDKGEGNQGEMGKEVQGSKERKEEMIKEHDNENGSKDRKEEK